MTNEEAIEYWEQFNAEIDDLYDACSDADRDVLVKQREIVEYTISALRKQETVANRNDPPTNAQKIRAMSDEELAEFLWDFNLSDVSTVKMGEFGPHMFRYRLKEWLQQPAEEVDHA